MRFSYLWFVCKIIVAKIVCASINGIVRIFLPVEREYKIEHLILEQDLGKPILQMSKGYFASYVVSIKLIVSCNLLETSIKTSLLVYCVFSTTTTD